MSMKNVAASYRGASLPRELFVEHLVPVRLLESFLAHSMAAKGYTFRHALHRVEGSAVVSIGVRIITCHLKRACR